MRSTVTLSCSDARGGAMRLAHLILLCVLAGPVTGRADEVPFDGTFRMPELATIWEALNAPTEDDFALQWQTIDPRKDRMMPDDWWAHFSLPPLYGAVALPADQFILSHLYRDGQLRYPAYTWGPYQPVFTIHETSAWLYAWNSPANPMHRNPALRLRAQQLALIHLVGLTQHVPGKPLSGGWEIAYGHCLAWNANTLRLLDSVEPVAPKLKDAWIACLDHVAQQIDALPVDRFQSPMGHWNLWPVAGAGLLYLATERNDHKALFDKWSGINLTPDAFTSAQRYTNGLSPVGYIRYSGVDLSYNGQAKYWLAPLFHLMGPDNVVGDYTRRQYRFASYVCVEEPNGQLVAPDHMNSHYYGGPGQEQWQGHRHVTYAADVPDAMPFARRAGYDPDKVIADFDTAFAEPFAKQQTELAVRMQVQEPIAYQAQGYPSGTMGVIFPYPTAYYPARRPADPAIRTRPHEHLAYAHWFRSPVVRDEFFVRRTPAYHFTLYSGPCRPDLSNGGPHVNGVGAGGLGHLWIQDVGTVLLAPLAIIDPDKADFAGAWSQLPVNALSGRTSQGEVLSTGWTGSLMTTDASGRSITIRGGIAPEVRSAWGTPMTDRIQWQRRFEFHDRRIEVNLTAEVRGGFDEAYELLPVLWVEGETKVSATADDGQIVEAPWTEDPLVRSVTIQRGADVGGIRIVLARPMVVSFAARDFEPRAPGKAKIKPLRLHVTDLQQNGQVHLRYAYEVIGPSHPPVVTVRTGSELSRAIAGRPYAIVLEAEGAPAVYWSVSDGRLPQGMKLLRNGLLAGTPVETGNFEIDLLGTNPYHTRPFFEPHVKASRVQLRVTNE